MDNSANSLLFLWLEITGKCQLRCEHCYADSSPTGTHGTMAEPHWLRVINEAAELGVQTVQFIGGEPTLHPSLPILIEHALDEGMAVEVFTNLVRIDDKLWEVLSSSGVSLATSYYSQIAGVHDSITGRTGSQRRTLSNIQRALSFGIPLRVGVVGMRDDQDVDEVMLSLAQLGVTDLGVDYLRQVGRGVRDQRQDVYQLCGKCADGTLAVSPTGDVWPCVFARWLCLGNVCEASLSTIHRSAVAAATREALEDAFRQREIARHDGFGDKSPGCNPNCHPNCNPRTCDPVCSPRCSPTCNPIACRPRECWPSFEDRAALTARPTIGDGEIAGGCPGTNG